MQKSHEKQKYFYDKTAKPLQPLDVGDKIHVHMGKSMEPAVVTRKHSDRSYFLETDDGGTYRRNRRFIRKTNHKQSNRQFDDTKSNRHFDGEEISANILHNTRSAHAPDCPNTSHVPSQDLTSRELSDPISPKVQSTPTKRPYVTRSGREVKQNKLFSGEMWQELINGRINVRCYVYIADANEHIAL